MTISEHDRKLAATARLKKARKQSRSAIPPEMLGALTMWRMWLDGFQEENISHIEQALAATFDKWMETTE